MGLATAFLDLLLPQTCAGCARPPALLCGPCASVLTAAPRPAWPSPVPRGLPRPWTACAYEGPVRSIITAHKERGRTSLAAPLGETLARPLQTALSHLPPTPATGVHPSPGRGGHIPPGGDGHVPPGGGGHVPPGSTGRVLPSAGSHVLWDGGRRGPPGAGVLIVPVPSGRRAVRRRGHDPTLRMAEAAAGRLRAAGAAVSVLQALRQRRRVLDQAGLPVGRRAANLAGALEVLSSAAVAGRTVVLVDDVITTGATLAEAARALRAADARVAAAATVAATPLRRAGP